MYSILLCYVLSCLSFSVRTDSFEFPPSPSEQTGGIIVDDEGSIQTAGGMSRTSCLTCSIASDCHLGSTEDLPTRSDIYPTVRLQNEKKLYGAKKVDWRIFGVLNCERVCRVVRKPRFKTYSAIIDTRTRSVLYYRGLNL